MPLYNRIDRRLLKKYMQESHEERVTLSFYRYVYIPEPQSLRDELYLVWEHFGVMGRVYIATEGINGQISVPKEHYDEFKAELYAREAFNNMRLNIAVEAQAKSFFKLKIQVKHKIVADGLSDDSFDASKCGTHLNAAAFNEMADRTDTVMVDMRNHYESEVGHFKGAILPDVDTFRESLPLIKDMLQAHRDKNILLYCTGGIRCEKASAYFKHEGFEKVYQLEGGIIKYAQDAHTQGLENKFIGKNFVFDERLGERISSDVIAHCHQCGSPCDAHTNCVNEACHLLFIQCDACRAKFDGCCSHHCQDFIRLPEEQQRHLRKTGIREVRNVFRKGRAEHLLHNED